MRSNSDLANLFHSTSIATLFLDNDLRIRRFTPRLLEVFNVREGDEGRPITDIVTRLTRNGLADDVQNVLRTLVPREREVTVAEGTSFLMQVGPYRDLNNVIDGAVLTFVDISERKRSEADRVRLAAIVESSTDAIISHDLQGAITSWNGGAEKLYGYSRAEAVGRPVSMLLERALPADWSDTLALLERGEQLAHFDSARVTKDGRVIDVSVTISPLREGEGRLVGASLVARDVSERKAAEQKAELLLGELDHRVKNILAIVSAVVSQTLKTSRTPEEFAAEVQGRVQAIAKAHSLLSHAGQGDVLLNTIIGTELAPYDRRDGNVVIAGPDVGLTPRAGLALALAIHELASNAAKYGALSITSGRLVVTWETVDAADGKTLTLRWTESGGPPVQTPERRGFGTTLIERALAHDLDAVVSRDFQATGLSCTIALPLTPEIGRLRGPGDAAAR